LEGTAAMRGTHGADNFATWQKKVLRAIFLFIILYPLSFISWTAFLLIFVVYAPSYTDLSELNGGRPNLWMKRWSIWKYLAKFFPLRLVKTEDLDPKGRYLFAMHPHGILPFGGMINVLSECSEISKVLEGVPIRTLAASFCFYIPIYREILLAGGVCDAARYSASKILKSGISIALVPGGATEALYTKPEEDILYLKKRKGFIHLAMTHGVKIVPLFSFNESGTYRQLSVDNKTVTWVKRKFQAIFGLSLPLITNIIPRRVPITTVVGKPLEIPHIENPTDEEVQKVLDSYIEHLTKMYQENGEKYNVPKDKKLIII